MALSATAKQRLTTLIRYMDKLNAKGRFSMKQWVSHKGRVATIEVHGIADAGKMDKKHLLECGMSACAVGWACTIPSFQKDGLMMKAGTFDDHDLRPVYAGEEHFDAVCKFFDLDERRARRLFGPFRRGVSTPKQWAADAKKVVAQWAD